MKIDGDVARAITACVKRLAETLPQGYYKQTKYFTPRGIDVLLPSYSYKPHIVAADSKLRWSIEEITLCTFQHSSGQSFARNHYKST